IEMQAKLLVNQREEVPCQEKCGTEPILRTEKEKKEEEDLNQLVEFG
ncbi:hypothetical protein NPIL_204191, partial [Nephila pilipes]